MAFSFKAPFFFLAAIAISMAIPSFAAVYTVGDTAGWSTGVDYNSWTSGKTFVTGDTLLFRYGSGAHTVDEVSGSDYNSCTAGNSISSDTSGSTTITLKKPGTHYFICGAFGHCSNGMKLAVTVADSGGAPSPSSTIPTPAPTGDEVSPSPAPTKSLGDEGVAPTAMPSLDSTPKDTDSSLINSPTSSSKVTVEASFASTRASAFATVVSAVVVATTALFGLF